LKFEAGLADTGLIHLYPKTIS